MTSRKRLEILSCALLMILLVSGGLLAEELDVTFNQVEFAQIFTVLGESQGFNVLVDPSVTGQGTFHLQGVTFKGALDLISQHSGYPYRLEGNTLLVGVPEDKEVRYVQTTQIGSSEVLEALQLVMPRSDVYVQPQGGLVVLHGTRDVLDRAEELIFALDNSVVGEKTPQKGRSLLDIFKDLSEELDLNLVADPAIENMNLIMDVRNRNPEELIKQISQLVPLRVEISEHSLVVATINQGLERLKVYRLDYAEPEATRAALALLIDGSMIQLDEERKSLTVRGTDQELAEVDLFMVDFDQPAPQVVLEVWVQETSLEGMRELGIDWKGTPSFLGGGDAPVFFELEWEPWELILALRALENEGEAKILANPQIATLNGKEASIFVGDRVPIVLDGPDGSRTMEFLESGINLKVTPRIADDDYITILVQPEVSTFIYRSDTSYPTIRTREAETTVRVKNGQPFVLGGLLQEQENETIRQIPFLSQLPVLGRLFQWKETKKNSTEMTIFVIPRIVEDGQGVVRQDFFTQTQ
jgi:type IV pilus assembly protein PilQ